jgi:cytochrome oxidase Cu insertion factor (SCO1/SenC/PrrC family)
VPGQPLTPAHFVRSACHLAAVPQVAEVRLHLGGDLLGLWQRTEDELGMGQPPPFWSFAWPGGQALAARTPRGRARGRAGPGMPNTTRRSSLAAMAGAGGRAGSRRPARPAMIALVLGLPVALAAVLVAVILSLTGSRPASPAAGPAQVSQAASNPNVDPGTSLPGTVAPGFTLTDQFGAPVSLRQFRGRAVVIAFVDSRCTNVCPLTTWSMTAALSMLGPAASRHVQLLGIDANPDAIRVADVRAYSAAHGMMSSWAFLTGSRSQLDAVWRAYHVYVAASHGNIDHEPAIYLIDPSGRERTLYLTQMAYAGVTQQADLIANGLSRLLPGHPAPRGEVPMTAARSIGPAAVTSLPVIGGDRGAGQFVLGRGHPHVVVFLASWISEVYDLPGELRVLAGYQREALRRGWPTVVVVDESQTEPGPGALSPSLARAGGGTLGYPVVPDTSGRLADGYGVQDLPWIAVTSPGGQIVFRHDGWLPVTTLARAAASAAARPAS